MEPFFSQAVKYIAEAQRILITTHERTDGDDLGTALAFYNFLTAQGKDVLVSVVGGVPKQLRFLPGSETVAEDIAEQNFDLLIISGCSNPNRIGNPKITSLQIPSINFDHHRDNTLFGTVNIVDHTKSSVAELAYDFFQAHRWPMSANVATCLLTGIFTDTGSFMHSNTESSTFKAASELMRRGGLLNKVAKNTFSGKDVSALRAWGRALENAYFDAKSKIIYSVITDKDLKDLGDVQPSVFEGLVETLNKVPDAKMALFLKQDGEVIKGSLRSESYKGINVSKVAKLFGGGGHALASGFSLVGKLTKDDAGSWQVVS